VASTKDRLLDTAGALFYREGIHAVGIQRLIDEAGIAKASLYAHFPSKDDLVAAYLEREADEARRGITTDILEGPGDARAKLLRLFDYVSHRLERTRFRGCPFLNAAGELTDSSHPARAVCTSYRAWLKGIITRLVGELGAPQPADLAGALLVLVDGAASTSQIDVHMAPALHARWAAEQLLDASLPAPRPNTRRRRQRTRSRGAAL
jgi:AcrR family transcriptional regulator